jgi:hypothetical protein
MPRPSHPSWLDNSNYTWRRVQVMKLLIMQFSPTSCHFIPLRNRLQEEMKVLCMRQCLYEPSPSRQIRIARSIFRAKFAYCLINYGACHVDVRESTGKLGTRMRLVFSRMSMSLYARGESVGCTLDWRLGWPHSRYERYGKESLPLTCWETNLTFSAVLPLVHRHTGWAMLGLLAPAACLNYTRASVWFWKAVSLTPISNLIKLA